MTMTITIHSPTQKGYFDVISNSGPFVLCLLCLHLHFLDKNKIYKIYVEKYMLKSKIFLVNYKRLIQMKRISPYTDWGPCCLCLRREKITPLIAATKLARLCRACTPFRPKECICYNFFRRSHGVSLVIKTIIYSLWPGAPFNQSMF